MTTFMAPAPNEQLPLSSFLNNPLTGKVPDGIMEVLGDGPEQHQPTNRSSKCPKFKKPKSSPSRAVR